MFKSFRVYDFIGISGECCRFVLLIAALDELDILPVPTAEAGGKFGLADYQKMAPGVFNLAACYQKTYPKFYHKMIKEMVEKTANINAAVFRELLSSNIASLSSFEARWKSRARHKRVSAIADILHRDNDFDRTEAAISLDHQACTSSSEIIHLIEYVNNNMQKRK